MDDSRVLVYDREGTAWEVDPDPTMAESIAADLRRVVGCELVPTALTLAAGVPPKLAAADAALFSPRAWADAPESVRASDRCHETRYVFDPVELSRHAAEFGWGPVVGAIR